MTAVLLRRGPIACEYRAATKLVGVLRKHCNPRWRYTIIAHSLVRGVVLHSRLEAIGLESGWPDFMFVGPGRVCSLKLHAPRGTAKASHGKIATHLMASGCGYAFAVNVAGAVDMLKDWGVLPPEA